ncbi:nucleotidyltransferase family protein [Desulfitobacterium sp. AusDCA]|uniref:nucleotidyltransferase family protein n=1 Tax=Desulfitobacterium sp. AusDCA TaxID=3240383 RepID=UPI003DA6F408
MRFGLDEELLKAIITCLRKEPTLNKAILFGSRARGTYRYNSDIDIAIECRRDIPVDLIMDIEEAAGVYKTDIVNLGNIRNMELLKSIEKDGVNLLNF